MSHTQFEHRNTEVNNAAGKPADLDNKLVNQALDILIDASRQVAAADNSSRSRTAQMVDTLLNVPCERATVVTSGGASNPAVINEKQHNSESTVGRAVTSGAIAGSIIGGAIASGAGATARKAASEGASAAGRSLSNGYEAGVIVGRTVAEIIAKGIGRDSGLSDIPTMPRNRANTPSENSSNLPPVIIKDGVINIGPRNSEPLNNKEGSGKQNLPNRSAHSLSEILRDSLIYPRTYEP